MRYLFAALLSGALGTVLACGPASQPAPDTAGGSGGPKYGGTLNTRVTADPWDWDISYNKASPNGKGVTLAYDSLLSFKFGADLDFNQLIVQPDLAERWEVSPDAKRFTFQLRKGVKFQDLPPVNGRELTSADVKWTYEYRTRSGEFKEMKLPAGELGYMFEGMDRIETPDPSRAVVHFKEPFVPFLSYAASDWNPILPHEIYDRDGHFKETIVGTSSLMLDLQASQKGARWVWKKNPNYWDGGRSYLDELRWLVIPHEATAYSAFQTRQLDLVDSVPYQDAQEVMKANPQAGQESYLIPASGLMYFSMAPARNSPLQDVRLRRALAMAVDRDEINKVAIGGRGVWGVSGGVDGLFPEAEARQLQKHDLEAARRLVAEAGFPNGVTLEWPVPADDDKVDLTVMELIQAQVKKANINIDLKLLERAAQRAKRRSGDFDIDGQMFPTLTGLMHDDPDSVIFGRLHSSSSQNYGRINDPDLDRILLATRAETDPEKRRELMRTGARRVVDMGYTVALLHSPLWDFWHAHVKGYRPNFGAQAAYKFPWIDR